MQLKKLSPVFTMVVVAISLVALHVANADSFPLSPIQPSAKQDAMNNTITDNLRLANQSSQILQEKLHPSETDNQQQPITANSLISPSNNKFDNHSPSVIAELPF
jgi:maltodextrin utilization protein YvdJ